MDPRKVKYGAGLSESCPVAEATDREVLWWAVITFGRRRAELEAERSRRGLPVRSRAELLAEAKARQYPKAEAR